MLASLTADKRHPLPPCPIKLGLDERPPLIVHGQIASSTEFHVIPLRHPHCALWLLLAAFPLRLECAQRASHFVCLFLLLPSRLPKRLCSGHAADVTIVCRQLKFLSSASQSDVVPRADRQSAPRRGHCACSHVRKFSRPEVTSPKGLCTVSSRGLASIFSSLLFVMFWLSILFFNLAHSVWCASVTVSGRVVQC